MRKLIYISSSIIGILALAILVLVALLITETGSRWLIHQAATHMPDELTIRRIQGSVLSGLNLYGVEYRIYNQHTQIQHVELSLQPMALLGGTVHFLSLHIQGVTYTAPEAKDIFTKDTIQVLPNISLPLAVVVDEARLDHLDFRLGNNRHTLEYVHLAGRVDRNGLQLKKLEAQGEGLHVNIQGRTSLHQPYPFQVNLNWSAQLPNGVQARGECDINGDADAVKFIHKLNAPFTIETLGEVKANSKLTEFNLTGSQPKVNWPLTGEAGCQGENRQYGKNGEAGSYQLTLNDKLTAQYLPQIHTRARGRDDLMSIQVKNLESQTLGGIVNVNGHVVLQPEPKWEFRVSARNIDPSIQWVDWPGRLAFDAKVQGEIDTGIPTVLLQKFKLVGHLLEQPFHVEGNMELHGRQLIFDDLRIFSGKNRINVNGTAAEHLDLRFNFSIQDPAALWPGLRGQFLGKGMLKGSYENPAVTVALEGNNIDYSNSQYGDYGVENLDVDLAFYSKNMQRSNARIKMINLQVNGEILSSLSLNWFGDFKNHKVRADVVTATACADIEFAGSCHNDIWEVRVDRASFDLMKYGIWRLRDPVKLLMGHTRMKPFKACWVQEQSTLCTQGLWHNETGWKVEGDLDAPPLIYTTSLLKELLKRRTAVQPEP